MSVWVRLAFALAFAATLSVATLLVALLISWDFANTYMESNFAGGVPALAFVIGLLFAPWAQRYLKSRRGRNQEGSMTWGMRIGYAAALTFVVSVVTWVALALITREMADSFLRDNYYAGIFVLAFLFAPMVGRLLSRFRSRE